jgi:hypothetical protein
MRSEAAPSAEATLARIASRWGASFVVPAVVPDADAVGH